MRTAIEVHIEYLGGQLEFHGYSVEEAVYDMLAWGIDDLQTLDIVECKGCNSELVWERLKKAVQFLYG